MSTDKPTDCLVTFLSTKYSDAFLLALIVFLGNLATLLVLYPAIPTMVSRVNELRLKSPFGANDQSNDNSHLLVNESEELTSRIHRESMHELENTVTLRAKNGRFFGMKFHSYLVLVAFVFAAFVVTIFFLMFAMDDPRQTWKDKGWKNAVGAQEILVIGFFNGVMILGYSMDSLIQHILNDELQHIPGRMFPHWSYYLFYFTYRGSLVTTQILMMVYWPYFVTYGIATSSQLLIVLAFCCTWPCWIFALTAIKHVVTVVFVTFVKSEAANPNLISSEEDTLVEQIANAAAGLGGYYLFILLTIVMTFAMTGGQTHQPVCVHSRKAVSLAIASNFSGAFIGTVTAALKKGSESLLQDEDLEEI